MSIAKTPNVPTYLQLRKGGAFVRMFALKAMVAHSTSGNRPPSHAIADWRAARVAKFTDPNCGLSAGYNTKNAGGKYEKRIPIWVAFDRQFRDEKDVHEVENARIHHTGWFVDSDQSRGMCIGIIGYLSHGRYISGYRLSDTGERVYFNQVFTVENEAVRNADREAELHAEAECEYNDRWDKAQSLYVDERESADRLRCYLTARNDQRTAGRDLAEMEIAVLRSIRAELADYSDIEVA